MPEEKAIDSPPSSAPTADSSACQVRCRPRARSRASRKFGRELERRPTAAPRSGRPCVDAGGVSGLMRPGSPGSTTRATSPSITTRGSIGTTSRPAAQPEQLVGGLERRQLLERLDRREHEQELAALVGLERAARRVPADVDASRRRRAAARRPAAPRRGRSACRSGSCTSAGVIQRENSISASGSGSATRRLLGDLAHAGRRGCPRRASTAPPGNTHAPPMKRCAGVALDEQDLERLAAAAQHDHGGGLRGASSAAPVFSSSPVPVGRPPWARRPYYRPMTTSTAQKWICESCGFIYDPAEGDPDGGIPPGTPFEEIPTDWFCPVCGARKADFSPTRTEPRWTGARPRLPPLELLVFVVGTSTLGAEIAAARLMAPFFGASTIVWANTIAVVLVALSVGYWFGGRMADRRPHLRGAVPARCWSPSVLLGARADRRAPVPLAQRRARSTTSRSARSPARCSACSRSSRSRC